MGQIAKGIRKVSTENGFKLSEIGSASARGRGYIGILSTWKFVKVNFEDELSD